MAALAPHEAAPERSRPLSPTGDDAPEDAPDDTRCEPVRPAAGPLFRPAALRAFRERRRVASALSVVEPKVGWVVGLLCTFVMLWLVVAALVSVEVTATARGVLRAPEGVHAVLARTPGSVTELLVPAGSQVTAGQLLARLDSTTLRARLEDAERQVQTLEREESQAWRKIADAIAERRRLLNLRAASVDRRSQRQAEELRAAEERRDRFLALAKEGLATAADVEGAQSATRAAMQSVLELNEERLEIAVALAETERHELQEQTQRERSLADARSAREAARVLLEDAELRAPAAGRFEPVQLALGQSVTPGQLLGRVVAAETPSTAILFVAERHRAFLAPGAAVELELDQLPMGEFGVLPGTVARIASEVASPEELTRELPAGDTTPEARFRVEIAIAPDRASPSVRAAVRSGAGVTARVHLRQQRVAVLLFEPLRRWLH
jgi:multidrug resistance efflux pump